MRTKEASLETLKTLSEVLDHFRRIPSGIMKPGSEIMKNLWIGIYNQVCLRIDSAIRNNLTQDLRNISIGCKRIKKI